MAAIGVAAQKRCEALERVLEALDMGDMRIPSTKAHPIETEAFYLEILERLAARVVALEAETRRRPKIAKAE